MFGNQQFGQQQFGQPDIESPQVVFSGNAALSQSPQTMAATGTTFAMAVGGGGLPYHVSLASCYDRELELARPPKPKPIIFSCVSKALISANALKSDCRLLKKQFTVKSRLVQNKNSGRARATYKRFANTPVFSGKGINELLPPLISAKGTMDIEPLDEEYLLTMFWGEQ